MNYENVDPQIFGLMSQLLHLQRQLVNQAPPDTKPAELIGAIGDFVNQLGAEIEKQAT